MTTIRLFWGPTMSLGDHMRSVDGPIRCFERLMRLPKIPIRSPEIPLRLLHGQMRSLGGQVKSQEGRMKVLEAQMRSLWESIKVTGSLDHTRA